MATPQITPEIIAKIQQAMTQEGNGGGYYRDAATNTGYAALNSSGWSRPGEENGFMGFADDGSKGGYKAFEGKERQRFDSQGKYLSSDTFAPRESMMKTALMYAAILASAGVAGGALSAYGIGGIGGAGAGAGGTGLSGLGGAGAVAGDAFLPGALAANGGFAVPYGSLIPGLEGFATAAGGAAGAVSGGDMGASGGYGVAGDAYMPGATNIGGNLGAAAPIQGLDAYAVGGAGAAGGAGGGGTGGATSTLGKAGSAVSGLLGQNGLGGLAALAGGVLGSKGQEQSASQTTKMDPRMDPFIYGDPQNKGLLQYAQQKLNEQMDPARMAGYKAMQNQGMGLMSGANVGNGFSKFSSR